MGPSRTRNRASAMTELTLVLLERGRESWELRNLRMRVRYAELDDLRGLVAAHLGRPPRRAPSMPSAQGMMSTHAIMPDSRIHTFRLGSIIAPTKNTAMGRVRAFKSRIILLAQLEHHL
jgi:hypothetical protein